MLRNSMSDTSSVIIPHSMRNDPKLFKDDKDIKFSKYYNSCRVCIKYNLNLIVL